MICVQNFDFIHAPEGGVLAMDVPHADVPPAVATLSVGQGHADLWRGNHLIRLDGFTLRASLRLPSRIVVTEFNQAGQVAYVYDALLEQRRG